MPSADDERGHDIEAQKSLLKDTDADEHEMIEKNTAEPSAAATVAPAQDGAIKSSTGSSSRSFLIWTLVNTLATIGIVFTNKAIFDDPSLKKMQTSFAAFHFLCTTLTLFVISRPTFGFFVPRRAGFLEIAPLSFAMCLNVILPNLSLAYSSITFYQIARILLTPLVALINYAFYHVSIARNAALALIPVCFGVGIVSYYDTLPDPNKPTQVTTAAGVIFAFSGVVASSLYTVWIGTYHRKLNMSSMQLLFNQAPVSSFLLLYFIPFCDTFPTWSGVPINRYVLIILSGGFASLINLSQFFIIAGAGAVSSTVVGHAKTCSIVILGWMVSGRAVTDKSLLGILMAIGGIITYSYATLQARK
ncbi:hypothetical protein DRE_06732 [Drechslerella stenobrocha 248]|uniref:GDP-mannose transporter n=1 Tax=Drechslerella stenobrocha 248 TaxID=1043628 RepID=W7HN00_9PEZI|nr:hypothetical protein DRE_06732 [Drechslerella stenobrocha 248]